MTILEALRIFGPMRLAELQFRTAGNPQVKAALRQLIDSELAELTPDGFDVTRLGRRRVASAWRLEKQAAAMSAWRKCKYPYEQGRPA